MRLIVFDCDSTLSSIEGIDELARAKGDAVFTEVAELTHAAMDGKVPLDEVFSRRLSIIEPDKQSCDAVAQLYIDTIEPTALETLAALEQRGYHIVILSGGFKRLIEPLASLLRVEHVEAVPLDLDEEGNYIGFDASYPTTYNGGKPEIIAQLKQQYTPSEVVMVGDGVSDLEVKPYVDKFIGFGRYTARAKVQEEADYFVYSLAEILAIVS